MPAEDQELVNNSEMKLFEIISNCTMVDRLRVPDCIIEEIQGWLRFNRVTVARENKVWFSKG